MAGYTPNYGAGSPDDQRPPTYRSYYDYLSSTFVEHFQNLPATLNDAGEERPRPLDRGRYMEDDDTNQSTTCAKLAVDFYSQQQGNSPISFLYAKDSHKFFSNGVAFFHVNFKAAFAGVNHQGEPYTFFAEVMGPSGYPENVTMVVQFHTKEERMTRDNCLYCTGLRHPQRGGFVGHRPNEADEEEEEEEEEADEGGSDNQEGDGDEEDDGDGN